MNTLKLITVLLFTCVCSFHVSGQVRNAAAQPSPTSASSQGREVNYYTITLTDGRVSVQVPDAANFLADPVGTLRKHGFKVSESSEPHWRSMTVALRRLANPTVLPLRLTQVDQTVFKNEVLRLQLPQGRIPVVGDGTISGADFLFDPIQSLQMQGIDLRPSDEPAWRQLAASLNSLRHDTAKNLVSNVRSSSKDPKAGTKEVQAEKEKERESDSTRPSVTGRITGIAVDPSRQNQKIANPDGQPDLIIKQFLFPPTNDKSLRVLIVNQGTAASGNCRLVLTIQKINGANVARQTQVVTPELGSGKSSWLVIDAKNILPNNVSLANTSFKLNADATGIVAESDEDNNEISHE